MIIVNAKVLMNKNKMKVYTTVYAFQSLTQQIGGKYVDAQSIYPAGADLHSYEPTQKDLILPKVICLSIQVIN